MIAIDLDDSELELIIDALRNNDWHTQAVHARTWIENNFMPGPHGDRVIADAETAELRAEALAERLRNRA